MRTCTFSIRPVTLTGLKKRLVLAAAIALLGMAMAPSVQAQGWWSATAVTATPHFGGGVAGTQTFGPGVRGWGIEMLPGFVGTTYAYIPVTAPNGSVFTRIYLRADDAEAGGLVTADFFRQPPGPVGPQHLGGVTSVTLPAPGFQTPVAVLPAPVFIDHSMFNYFIRLTLKRDGLPQPNLRAYGVALQP